MLNMQKTKNNSVNKISVLLLVLSSLIDICFIAVTILNYNGFRLIVSIVSILMTIKLMQQTFDF